MLITENAPRKCTRLEGHYLSISVALYQRADILSFLSLIFNNSALITQKQRSWFSIAIGAKSSAGLPLIENRFD